MKWTDEMSEILQICLDQIYEEKAKGASIQSRKKWMEWGGKMLLFLSFGEQFWNVPFE